MSTILAFLSQSGRQAEHHWVALQRSLFYNADPYRLPNEGMFLIMDYRRVEGNMSRALLTMKMLSAFCHQNYRCICITVYVERTNGQSLCLRLAAMLK